MKQDEINTIWTGMCDEFEAAKVAHDKAMVAATNSMTRGDRNTRVFDEFEAAAKKLEDVLERMREFAKLYA